MTDHDPFVPGAIFAADFLVVRPLSAGGMGAVYVVDQISSGKRLALKVLDPQLVATPDLRRRFAQEARIGAQTDSEHAVEVLGAGVDATSGLPYLVMELLEGEDLGATVRRRGPRPPSEVFAIYKQLCQVMTAAHGVGIVHGALKPENVFLARPTRPGVPFTVKVLDFGVASLLADPAWLAPEQTEGQPVGPTADVWALGLIAFHLLAGFPFWSDASSSGVEPVPLASVRAAQKGVSLPAGFDGWFARCVARDPAARFPNAGVAFIALTPLLEEIPVLVPAPAIPQTPPPASQSGTTSAGSVSSMTVAAGAAVVVLLVAGGLLARARLRPAPPPEPSPVRTATATATTATEAPSAFEAPTAPATTSAAPLSAAAPDPTGVAVDPNASLADQARTLLEAEDVAGAKLLLQPRVFDGRANTEEIDLLRQICQAQADRVCLGKITKAYPPAPAGPATVPNERTCGCPKDDLGCMLTCANAKGRRRH